MLEIGPGPGALTSILCDTCAHVYAIEKDPSFQTVLNHPNLTLFCEDALTFPMDTLPHPLKVVANLPYHITTPLLEKFFSHASHFSSLTLMVQKELAMRLSAKPNTAAFSSLTLFAQYHATLQTHFRTPASCFYPRPSVDSTVLHFTLNPPLLENPENFFHLIRRAFQKRRKMLRASLKELFSQKQIEKTLLAIGSRADARPEALSLDQWLKFFKETRCF